MEYVFSWGWFFIGLIIIAIAVALVAWYRPLADNFGGGVGSYERFRMWGLIGVLVGFAVMLNLHSVFLGWVVSLILPGV